MKRLVGVVYITFAALSYLIAAAVTGIGVLRLYQFLAVDPGAAAARAAGNLIGAALFVWLGNRGLVTGKRYWGSNHKEAEK